MQNRGVTVYRISQIDKSVSDFRTCARRISMYVETDKICIPDPISLPLLLHPFARASPASIVDLAKGFDQGSAEIQKI